MEDSKKILTPWHLWLVGTLAILFNGMGAFDYVMTQNGNEEYLQNTAGFSLEQIEYFARFPSWADALWAIGVWGGVLGGILLLLKKSLAVPVLFCSFVGGAAGMSHIYIFSNGLEVVGTLGNITFAVIIVNFGYGFFHYARSMKQKGVLG